MKNLKNLGKALNREEQKLIVGGIRPGSCVSSNRPCLYIGNAGCPKFEGCYLEPDGQSAFCRCTAGA